MKHQFKYVSLITILVLFAVAARASAVNALISRGDSIARQKDIVDVYRRIFNSGAHPDTTGLYGNGPFYAIVPAVGYGMHTGITGLVSTNITFYANEMRKKISRITFEADYSQFHQYWFKSTSNVFFERLRLHLFSDIRCMKFPTQTFGMGPDSKLSNSLRIDYSYLRLYQLFFREILPDLFVGAGYNLDYHWDVKADTATGPALEQFLKCQNGRKSVSSGFTFNLLFDSRTNTVNPKSGSFFNLQVRPNLKITGSDSNWQSLLIDIRHYFDLSSGSKHILAFWYYSNFTLSGTPPYLDMPATGWDNYSNTGRGYVPGRFTGRNFIYLESEFRFTLTNSGLLGGVVFCNGQYIKDKLADNQFRIRPGTGLGLRIKINKFTGTNLGIDYGFGIGGSHGLFFNMGEVF
jgi:outer membrane protein assembly factor BamA